MISFFTGSNSSALSSNASSLTSNNGVGNQMVLSNATNTSSKPAALNSTHAPTAQGSTARTAERTPVNTGKGPSVPITPAKDKNSVTEKPKITKPFVTVVSSTTNQSDDEGKVLSSRKINIQTNLRDSHEKSQDFRGKNKILKWYCDQKKQFLFYFGFQNYVN